MNELALRAAIEALEAQYEALGAQIEALATLLPDEEADEPAHPPTAATPPAVVGAPAPCAHPRLEPAGGFGSDGFMLCSVCGARVERRR